MLCISFEMNIQILKFVFEYVNIRTFSEYSSICLSPNHEFVQACTSYCTGGFKFKELAPKV